MSNCMGIFIEEGASRRLFNYALALKQGESIIMRTDFGGDPERTRIAVENGLRRSHPYVTVGYWDCDAEIECPGPLEDGTYCLMIKQETPMYSSLSLTH